MSCHREAEVTAEWSETNTAFRAERFVWNRAHRLGTCLNLYQLHWLMSANKVTKTLGVRCVTTARVLHLRFNRDAGLYSWQTSQRFWLSLHWKGFSWQEQPDLTITMISQETPVLFCFLPCSLLIFIQHDISLGFILSNNFVVCVWWPVFLPGQLTATPTLFYAFMHFGWIFFLTLNTFWLFLFVQEGYFCLF